MEKNDKLELIGVIATLTEQLQDTEERRAQWFNDWVKLTTENDELKKTVEGLKTKIFNLESELKIAKGE